jgi:hypothetical protein
VGGAVVGLSFVYIFFISTFSFSFSWLMDDDVARGRSVPGMRHSSASSTLSALGSEGWEGLGDGGEDGFAIPAAAAADGEGGEGSGAGMLWRSEVREDDDAQQDDHAEEGEGKAEDYAEEEGKRRKTVMVGKKRMTMRRKWKTSRRSGRSSCELWRSGGTLRPRSRHF